MRLFYAALALEANTFLPVPTSYQAFLDKLYYPPGRHPEEAGHQTGAIAAARATAKRSGFELIEGSCYAAQPGGAASRAAYERMRDEILGQLKAALPVDGAVFNLHGAMVADGYDDCEGDFLERVRALVGPKAVIGVELDPHCHLTIKRCNAADVIVLFKEYPHTDFAERGEEMIDLTLRTIRHQIKPVKSVFDCRVIQSFPTSIQPMRGLVDKIMALEGKNRVLSVSIAHCFYYGDAPECGARILVLTDDAKPHGDKLAEEIGRELIALREQAAPPEYSVDGALDFALAHPGGPIVIADTTDNAGGGAPSDNTTVVHRLLARGIKSAAVAPIWDPIAVRMAFDAGEGAKLPFRFGGKIAKSSGPPVDADVEVIRCVPNAFQSFSGATVGIGDAASIRMNGVEAVLISTRAQGMGTDLFSNLGIDPKQRKILVVKSNQHFYASFSQIAAQIIYAEGDGPLPRDYKRLPWRKVQRPIWPLDTVTEPRLII
ncbi:MAG: M81 family metallopeptidase [Alphaproteobacteria bacterium]|nr:MAG: M81 family metallopeptidase [Alphaproteobacteria bacterium]